MTRVTSDSNSDNTSDVLRLHAELVGIPSLSHKEGPIMDFVCEYLERSGVEPNRFDNNVWFEVGQGENTLLLATHLDVVPPSSDHPFSPFEAVEKDGKIYGRGSVDAKASAASMMSAVLALAREGFDPYNGKIIVALTSCEEVGGAYNGLEQLRTTSDMPQPSAALVGEPTSLHPCLAQKGLLILHMTARGRTAHAARAHLGKNALYGAARDLLRIESYVFEREDPFLGPPTMVASVIEGGTAHNVVPDSCMVTLDIRSTPAYTHDEIVSELQQHLDSELIVHSGRYVPVGTAASERIAQVCITESGQAPFGSPTASDWIFLQDIPAVKIGPGESNLSHTAEEHIERDELTAAVDLYQRIIRRYFCER